MASGAGKRVGGSINTKLPVLAVSRQSTGKRTYAETEGGEQSMLKLFINLKLAFARAMDEEEGQGLTEYALILALIAIVAIAALTLLGGKVQSALSTVATSLTT
jgi:pilus assembly protein Flp/PilA